jgi:acyl-CoA synthetase (AMP-forming)/AMP-acid ligase II
MHRHNEILLGDILRKAAKLNPDKEAIIFKENRFTFKTFFERTNNIANFLMNSGVKKGDRIAVLMENCHQYAELYFAIPKSGGIAVPINYRLAAEEIEWIINFSEANTLIFGEKYIDTIRRIRSTIPSVRNFIGIGIIGNEFINYDNMLSGSSDEPHVDIHDDDVACIYWTSGTTGRPKGAMLTHRNLISSATNTCVCYKESFGDSFIIISPMFHSASPCHLFARVSMGNTCVILEGWEMRLYLETIQKEKITHIFLLPTMIRWVLESAVVQNYDLSTLRLLHYGGAPLDVDTIKKAKKIFGCDLIQGFGMTEIGPSAVSESTREDHILDGSTEKEERFASVGRDAFNAEVRIVDDDDNEVPVGEVGEICVRGQHVMKGYWRMPTETDEALKNGWFHTGDLGRRDKGGYIYVVDRKKDMIISGAENIYSAEVERAISFHPAVSEVAVVGVPDKIWGEAVKAVVVLKEGVEATEEEIIEHCKKHLASYKKPKSVDFVKELPKSEMGKILKRDLRATYWEGHEKGVY